MGGFSMPVLRSVNLGAALAAAEKQAELAIQFGEIRSNSALDALLSAQNATNLVRMGEFEQWWSFEETLKELEVRLIPQ